MPDGVTTVSSVTDDHMSAANWLLTMEALRLYRSPYRLFSFNYAQYGGGFCSTEE